MKNFYSDNDRQEDSGSDAALILLFVIATGALLAYLLGVI